MNRSSSKGESYHVFISYHHADRGEDTLERRFFGPAAVPCFSVDNAFTGVPEALQQPGFLDQVRGRIALIGASHCGKTSTLSELFGKRAVAWRSGRRETLLRYLASPGGTISDRDHFEWGRLRHFDSVFHDSCSDRSWESFIEEAREQHSRQDGPKESPVFAWTHASCEGFLLNRLLSYPQSELLKFGEGVHGLGGLFSAFDCAWKLISWRMGAKARIGVAVPTVPDDSDASVLSWATTLVHWHGCEVWDDDEPGLKGCLVKTRTRLVIHLNSDLDARTRRFVLLHELAHHLLRHRPNTEYGLAPAALDEPDVLWSFKRQERTADALASIWSYLLEGLDTIVRRIGSQQGLEAGSATSGEIRGPLQ